MTKAQQHYYREYAGTRWLSLGSLHELITQEVKEQETTYQRHCVTYAAWFQGISGPEVGPRLLSKDRNLYRDLVQAGIHPTLLPMAAGKGRSAREKGVDVALAISAMEVAFTNRVDLIALVTGDADFVPLVWALKRRGLRVGVFGFDYPASDSDGGHDGGSRLAQALCDAANYFVNLSSRKGQFEQFLSPREPRGLSQTDDA